MHAQDENAGQILTGSADAVTVRPWTDADVRHATDPNAGHIAVGFEPEGTLQPPCLAWPSSPELTAAKQDTQR